MAQNRARRSLAAGRAGEITLIRYGLASAQAASTLDPWRRGWITRRRQQEFESRQLALPDEVGAVRDAPDRIISPKEDE